MEHTGNLWENWGGLGERWLLGSDGWHFVKPDGDFHRWNRAPTTATGTLVATLDPVFFHHPELLHNAEPGDLAYVLDGALGLTHSGRLWAHADRRRACR
ncbi:MAG: hypothetical protein L0215_08245 [Gemmataceae bacterium]|nr:hypothetical protein [Gemmataceae bacterium]